MKFKPCIFVFILIFACISFGSFDEPVKIHEWKFEGNAQDTSGSGNHGSWSGMESYGNGVFGGRAGYFNGSSWIEKSGANIVPLSEGGGWTMNVWVNMQSSEIADLAIIAGFGGTDSADSGRWIQGVDSKVSFGGFGLRGFLDKHSIVGVWTMVTVVAKESSFQLYVNGESVHECVADKAADVVERNIFAAGPMFGGSKRFRGKIDNFTIWDCPLAEMQIKSLYKSNKVVARRAFDPRPGDKEDWKYYDCSKVRLEWRGMDAASSYDVYFGRDYDKVLNADQESSEFKGNIKESFFDVTDLSADRQYYWRIDEVDGGRVWPGKVWGFYTENDWQKEGWVLTFHDEFDGDKLDETKWGIGYPGWHAGARTPMAFPQNDQSVYKLDDGILGLVNRKQDYNDVALKHYVSGLIQTKGKFDQAYGWFEARCKMPGYLGDFPAFWLFPSGNIKTPRAEVDIMEHWHREGETVAAHMHWGGYGAGHKWVGSYMHTVPGLWRGFHTYAMKWEPGKLTFYVDDVPYWDYSGKEVPSAKLWVILNNALDQSGIDESAMPTYFEVDHVRVYRAE